MIKRFSRFGSRIVAAVATVAFALTVGITTATADFDAAPDSVEFERISVQSEQTLVDAGFMDKTNYGWCDGWYCRKASDCGDFCWCDWGQCAG